MIGNWRRVIGVLVVAFVLRLAADLQASVCDDNALVNDLMGPLMLDNMVDDIYELLVDEQTGKGALIELISDDIEYDVLVPPPEVMECAGAACSSVPLSHSPEKKGRAVDLVFLLLPASITAGVVLWRRRRGAIR